MHSGHEVDTMVKTMMVELLKARPEEPNSWMLAYMLSKNAGLATLAGTCAVASTSAKEGPQMHLAVSNPSSATQQVGNKHRSWLSWAMTGGHQ